MEEWKLLGIKPFFDYFYIAIPRFREFVTSNDLLGTGIGLISVPNYCFIQEGFKILKKANKLKRLYVPKFSYCKSLYQLASKISRDVVIENKEWKEHIKPNFLFWKSLRAMSQAKYLFREGWLKSWMSNPKLFFKLLFVFSTFLFVFPNA